MAAPDSIGIAIIAGAFALAGSLGAQLIAGGKAVRAKKLEILYVRKADAYVALIEAAAAFGIDSRNTEKFAVFQHALHRALLVASRSVAAHLSENPRISLHVQAIRLLNARDDQVLHKQVHGWTPAMEAVISEMRRDLLTYTDALSWLPWRHGRMKERNTKSAQA